MATGKYWQTLTLSTLLVLMSSIAFFGTQISDVDTTELQIDETDGYSGTANIPGFQSGSIFTHDSLAAGSEHTCAILSDETMSCWGANTFGQLGTGDTTASPTPAGVSFVNPGGITTLYPVSVSSSQYHTCTVLNDGSVQCWGDNAYGQLGDGTNTSQSSPTGVDFGQGHSAVMVGVGKTHTCAILEDASVSCWGYNIHGQLGDGTNTQRNAPISVDLGQDRSAVAISLGESHTCALLDDTTLKCWGFNNHGQLGDGTLTSSNAPTTIDFGDDTAVAMSAGRHHTCALLSDESTSCWGWNDRGQLGDGTIVSQSSPTSVDTNGTGVISLSTGDRHTCAVLDNGTAICWGNNIFGQLGNGANSNSQIPVFTGLSSGTNIVGMVTGTHHTCAAIDDGSVQCWGGNNEGQLGDGSTSSTNSPGTAIGSLTLALDDRDRDNDGTLDIYDTHIAGDEDGDGIPTPDDQFPTNPARSESCNAGFYGRYSCQEADAGYHAPVGSIIQLRCDAGTYQPSTGQESCIDADAGHYVPEEGATMQESCTIGQYQALPGQPSCDDAAPGYFVDTTNATTQSECAIGTYQSNSAQSSCIDASPGYYVDNPASASQTACSPGSYNPDTASNNSSACQSADIGHYVSQSGQSSQTTASPGYYVDTTGASSQTPCLAGTYNPDTASNSSSACLDADLGYYVNQQGRSSQSPAMPGYYVDTTGATSQTPCQPGTYNPNSTSTDSSACLDADLGYYVSQSGRSSQTPASSGYYVDTTAATAQLACSPGTYNPATASTNASACLDADLGYYVSQSGRSSQTPASPGYYVDTTAATAQIACSPGTYNPVSTSDSASACLAADLGYYVSQSGRSSQTPASSGHYVDTNGATGQTPCLPGTYNPSSAATSSAACLPTDSGYKAPNSGTSQQIACSPGTYQPNTGQIDCLDTDPGHFASGSGNSDQTSCLEGSFINTTQSSACSPAPQGTYANGTGNINPTNCPTGTATIGQSSTSLDDCLTDSDDDGIPNEIDDDDDNDGVNDSNDAFPTNSAETDDTDGDGVGNNADDDDDNDGWPDPTDHFPLDDSEWLDTDADNIGNNVDTDDDGDGWTDADEATCGSDSLDHSNLPIDTDSDSICDVMDDDDDGDTILDSNDICPGHDDTLDWDGDGIPDGCENNLDLDFDGVMNTEDQCPETPFTEVTQVDEYGCSPSESGDDDGDGVPDAADICPDTASEEIPNSEGCGVSQRDTDNDGWTDSEEQECGHDHLDGSDVPDASCGAGEESTSEESSSIFSSWILIILLLIIVLAVLMLLSSSRDEDGNITFNITKITTVLSKESGDDDDPFANLEGEASPQASPVDDWEDDSEPFVADTVEADAKIAEMDAKMAEMDDKMAEMSKKEAQLARIASNAESIDFETIGTASIADKNDLRKIKGIGPFIEEKLNALGIFTFAQLANMTPEIEEQVNEAIEFFSGRIKRDKWSTQATELDSDKEEEELPNMAELVSDKEKVDDETFEDVDWE